MRYYFILLIGALVCGAISATAQTQAMGYDQALADSLGADEFGMRQYILVLLKTGSVQITDRTVRDSLFTGHLSNINRLADNGSLVLAGPMGSNPMSYRGLFLFNVTTLAEAEQLLKTDPAVQAKFFEAEMYQWYGSAAIPEYLKVHRRIEKRKH